MRWIEISLQVSPEAVELAAEVLRQFGYQGVAVEREPFEIEPSEDEIPPPRYLTVRAYVPDNLYIDDLKQQIENALALLGYPAPQYHALPEGAYQQEWMIERFSIPVGQRTFICPVWIAKSANPGEVVIVLESSAAFGTGTHPTTRMMLEAAEGIADKIAGSRVLDLGCGSGILGIGAVKLGAASVLGLDIEPNAVRIAGENAVRNGVADKFTAQLGSLDSLLAPPQQFDVVLANIIGQVIIEMCRTNLHTILRPDSIALLSGIKEHEVAQLERAMQSTGLKAYDRRITDGWVALWVGLDD
jgi:ribosomal protein L11 methyltransferase